MSNECDEQKQEVMLLHHATIEVPFGAERHVRHFYGGLLGLMEMEIPSPFLAHEHEGVWYEIGGVQQLHFGPVADFHPQRRGHVALCVRHLAALRQVFQQAGVRIEEEAVVQEPGWDRLYVFDFFGNRIELREQK